MADRLEENVAKLPKKKPTAKAAPPQSVLRKYTNLAVAVDILQMKHLTLLDESTWDDKNDAWFISEYKDIIGASSVLASCFAETDETYHHWRVFSDGMAGVCIEFDKARLLSAFDGVNGILRGRMIYRKIDTLRRRDRIEPEELPFLKRRPYKPECEYRVVYTETAGEPLTAKCFPIEIQWITRITLSPWMPPELRTSVTRTLKAINGCERLRVLRSTLVSNRQWRALTAKARLGSRQNLSS